jgi:hypothetical protein
VSAFTADNSQLTEKLNRIVAAQVSDTTEVEQRTEVDKIKQNASGLKLTAKS